MSPRATRAIDEPSALYRETPDGARTLIEGFLPGGVRARCLTALASSIELAYEQGASCWSVSLRRHPDGVRLNVGRAQAFVLGRYGADTVYLSIDGAALDANERQALEEAGTKFTAEEFRSVPGGIGALVPADQFEHAFQVLEEAHRRFIERAASAVSERTPYYAAHSPGVLAYLETVVGRSLPNPAYEASLPPVDELSPLERAMQDFESEVDEAALDTYRGWFHDARERFHSLFGSPEAIAALTPESFLEFFNGVDTHGPHGAGLWTFNLRIPKDPATRTFQWLVEDMDNLRGALTQLLHGDGPEAERINFVLHGPRVRTYVTDSLPIVSALLCLRDPETHSFVTQMWLKRAKLEAATALPDIPADATVGQQFEALERALVELPESHGRDWDYAMRARFYFSDAFRRHLEQTAKDPLASLVERFRQFYPKAYDEESVKLREEYADYLTPVALEDFDWPRFQAIFSGSGYGRTGPMSGLNRNINEDRDGYRERLLKAIWHLLYGPTDLERRLADVLDGDMRAAGFGEAVAFKLLSITQPERILPLFTMDGDRGRRHLMSIPAIGLTPPQEGPRAEMALRANDMLRERLEPYLGDDVHGMREFLYWLDGYRWRETGERPTPERTETDGGDRADTDAFAAILRHISDEKLFFPVETVSNYLLALQAKRFVILTGISGTGKTKLALAVAHAFRPSVMAQRAVSVPEDATTVTVDKGVWYGTIKVPGTLVSLIDLPPLDAEKQSVRIPVDLPTTSLDLTLKDYGTDGWYLHLRGDAWKWAKTGLREGDLLVIEALKADGPGGQDGLRIRRAETEAVRQAWSNYTLVAVRPDWTDNRGLLGYFNPLTGRYVMTPFLQGLLAAANEARRAEGEGRAPHPYFLILDEMNLARVEHYFSDFLSALESGEPLHLHDDAATESGQTGDGTAVPRLLHIPPNVLFTGTVNVDETTYMFSPKVLDRAFTVELNRVDLAAYGEEAGNGGSPGLVLCGMPRHLDLGRNPDPSDWRAFAGLLDSALRLSVVHLNAAMEGDGRPFGYRVANEIARYVLLAAEQAGDDGATLWTALDLALLQKVLPKVHGTQQEVEPLLARLFASATAGVTAGPPDAGGIEEGWLEAQHWSVIDGRAERADGLEAMPARLPRTSAKVLRMWRRCRLQGFTSFIE